MTYPIALRIIVTVLVTLLCAVHFSFRGIPWMLDAIARRARMETLIITTMNLILLMVLIFGILATWVTKP